MITPAIIDITEEIYINRQFIVSVKASDYTAGSTLSVKIKDVTTNVVGLLPSFTIDDTIFNIVGIPTPFSKNITYLNKDLDSEIVNNFIALPNDFKAVYKFSAPSTQIFYGVVTCKYDVTEKTSLNPSVGITTHHIETAEIVVRYDYAKNNEALKTNVGKGF